MKTSKKVWLIIAAVLIIAGMALSVVGAVNINWSDRGSFDLVDPESVTHNVEGEFTDISVFEADCDIRFALSEDGKCTVVADDSDFLVHTVEVKDGTLYISVKDNRKWFEHISLGWSYEKKVTIYLPEKEYGDVTITSASGDISMPKDFSFDSISAECASGDVYIAASAKGDVKISTASGNIDVSSANCKDLSMKTASGDIELKGVIVEKHLSASTASGDVEFHECDADTVKIDTASGDVEGSFLSGKTFITDTASGEVEVPRSSQGGRCEIETASGDIEIKIK